MADKTNDTLWCVHIYGPDEFLPARSYEEAQHHAQALNMTLARALPTEHDPVTRAIPEFWPWGEDAWRAALADQIRQHGESYPWPAQRAADKTMPTPGPWQVQDPHQPWDDDERAAFVTGGGKPGTQHEGLIAACCRTSLRDDHTEDAANARLIAAAGTAAHEVAQMGYDPVETVRALPGLIYHSARLRHFLCRSVNAGPMSNNPKGEMAILRDLYANLDRAAGKDGDDGQ